MSVKRIIFGVMVGCWLLTANLKALPPDYHPEPFCRQIIQDYFKDRMSREEFDILFERYCTHEKDEDTTNDSD